MNKATYCSGVEDTHFLEWQNREIFMISGEERVKLNAEVFG